MAHRAQLVGNGLARLTLQFEPPAADPLDARRIKRLLRVHVIIERVDEDLSLTLRLHERAHHAERTDGGAVPEQEAGNDGVVGPLAAGKAVVACGVEREVCAAVLERDARPRHGDARAEGGVIALDERDHVALAVSGAEIDGAAAVRVARPRLQRAVGDERAARGEIGGIQQLADLSFHIARVGDVGPRVGKGQLDGLHHLVIVLGALALFRHGHAVQDAERHEHRNAVAVRRDLTGRIAAVFLRDGLDPFGAIIAEVVLAEVPAGRAGERDDPLHQRAAVIALAVRRGEGAQRRGVVRKAEQLTRAVGRAVRLHKALPPVFVRRGVLRHRLGNAAAVALPLPRDVHRHGIALLGIGNGGREQLSERLRAEAAVQLRPARGCAGHHRRQPSGLRHLCIAHRTDLLRAQRHRRDTAGVEAVEPFVPLDPHERKAVRAEAVAGRLEQRHSRGHRHSGVHGVAAGFHHVQSDLCAERHRRAGDGIFGVDDIAPRGIAVGQRIEGRHGKRSPFLFYNRPSIAHRHGKSKAAVRLPHGRL